jgi:hypothetical protein
LTSDAELSKTIAKDGTQKTLQTRHKRQASLFLDKEQKKKILEKLDMFIKDPAPHLRETSLQKYRQGPMLLNFLRLPLLNKQKKSEGLPVASSSNFV